MRNFLAKWNTYFAVSSAAFGRLVSQISFYGVRNYESLIGGEYPLSVKFKICETEFRKEEQTFSDPRTGIELNHTFTNRYFIEIYESIWDTKTGMAFTKQNRTGISETSSRSEAQLRSTVLPLPAHYLSRDGVYIIMPSNGYYHWLLEDLPNFLLTQNKFPNSEVLVWEKAPSYVLDFLNAKSIRYTFSRRFEEISQVNILSKGSDSGWNSKQDVSVLRNSILTTQAKGILEEKIYISRRNSTRSPKWEQALIELLTVDGWNVIESESMDLMTQFNRVGNAKVICGVHGAGLANMITLSPGSVVIELGGSSFRRCFVSLATACDLSYIRLEFRDSDNRDVFRVAGEINLQISKVLSCSN
jgi:hypothetical protein